MTREKIREWRGQQENVKCGNHGDAEKGRRGDDIAEEQTVQTDVSESSVDQEKAPKQEKTEKDKVKTMEETTVPA